MQAQQDDSMMLRIKSLGRRGSAFLQTTSRRLAERMGIGTYERARIALGITVFAALGVIMPVLLVIVESDAGRSGAWVAALAVMVLGALRLAKLIAMGELRLLELVFWIFVYIFLGLAPAVQIRADAIPVTTPNIPARFDTPAVLAVIVGVLSFMAGTAVARSKRRHGVHAQRQAAPINVRAAKVLLLFGFAFAAYYVSQIGFRSLFIHKDSLDLLRLEIWSNIATSAIVLSLAIYPLLIATHALAYARQHQSLEMRRRSTKLAWLGALVVLVVANPISTARQVFGAVWGSFLSVTGAFRTRARTTITMLGVVMLFLFVFPIADAFRRPESSAGRAGFFAEYESNGDYDAFWQIANALAYTDDNGITWGRQLLGSLLFWMPRSIWPGKPVDTGILLAEHKGYSFTNLSAPLWAEALVNFGWIGLVVILFLVGMLIGTADLAAAKALKDGTWPIIPVATTSFYLFILLRGSLLQATGGFVVMMICGLIVRGWRPPLGERLARLLRAHRPNRVPRSPDHRSGV